MMTVAIIETVHFQYGLSVAELFEQEDKIFFVTQEMHDRMHSHAPDLCKGQFVIIEKKPRNFDSVFSRT